MFIIELWHEVRDALAFCVLGHRTLVEVLYICSIFVKLFAFWQLKLKARSGLIGIPEKVLARYFLPSLSPGFGRLWLVSCTWSTLHGFLYFCPHVGRFIVHLAQELRLLQDGFLLVAEDPEAAERQPSRRRFNGSTVSERRRLNRRCQGGLR